MSCSSAADLYAVLSNRTTLLVRECLKRYYDGWHQCDDAGCGYRTTLPYRRCGQFNCTGMMIPVRQMMHLTS